MIKINSFYNQQELDRYYDFVLKKKPSIVKTNGKGTAMVTLLNKLPKKNSQKIKIKDVYELLTMDFTKLKSFCDSLATDNKRYKKLIKQSEKDLRIYKSYYSGIFHLIDETIGIRNNMILVKNLDVTVCPYCNRNYINSRKNYLGANFDHYYDKDKYPFFALTLSNLIPCCDTCNRIKGTQTYKFCPFDLKSKEEILFKVSPIGNSSRIKLYFDSVQQNNNILELEEAYQIHQVDVDNMFSREQEYCKEYRKSLEELLETENSKIDITDSFFDAMIYGEIASPSFNNYLKISLAKLKKDTYNYIVELRRNER
ncbi:hypothetical protein PCY08_06790 [Streptococcus sp. SO4]|uniref:hypothetical protein n=1 Tax=Streptococcus sp. SO4 TaxID=3018249 RepID=UPI00263DD1C6|nr:hypothetical protein [Streptococcus sp. SO4]MDN5025147.1 hypothetical protein [Streptococcus sp. SO4]